MGVKASAIAVSAELTARLYEWALARQPLGELLEWLRQELKADGLQLIERQLPGGALRASHFAGAPGLQRFHAEYLEQWGGLDPLGRCAMEGAPFQVLRCHADLPPGTDDSAFRLFLARHGLRWSMAGSFQPQAGRRTLLLAHATPEGGPFGDPAAAWLSGWLPLFVRAGAAAQQAQRRARPGDLATAVLRQLPLGCVVADEFGRCIDTNDEFRELTKRLGIRVILGRLRFRERHQQAAWEQGLRETFATGVRRTVRFTAAATPLPCTILFQPCSLAEDGSGTRLVIALFEERTAPLAAPAEPQRALGAHLTRAELEVLAALLTGLPAKSIAVQRGASVNTVRSQIVSILEKTEFRSQRELIASFGGSAASGFVDSVLGHSSSDHDSTP